MKPAPFDYYAPRDTGGGPGLLEKLGMMISMPKSWPGSKPDADAEPAHGQA